MKNQFFKDKVVLITGSTLGIGKSLAYQLARSGSKVILNGRNIERLSAVEQAMKLEGLEVTGINADITNFEDCGKLIHSALEKYKKIDFLLLMAGLSMNGKIEELKPEVFRKVMETNYFGSVYPVLHALPYLRETGGSVLFASSVSGMVGFPRFSAYCASKMALTAFAGSLRNELNTEIKVGITYISFTENEPEKRIMATDGTLMKKKEMNTVMKYDARQKVVDKIIKQLKSGRFSCNYSFYGKGIRFMNFFFPDLLTKLIFLGDKKINS